MKLKRIRLTLVVLLVCAATVVYGRSTSRDRKAEKVFNEYISAIGGKAAVEGLHNLVSQSELMFLESGMTIDREMTETRMNCYYIKVSSPQIGEITRGYDGKTCWEYRQETVRKIAGEEKKSFLNSSSMLRFAEWEKHLVDYSYAGLVNIEGKKMHKIDVTTCFGISETWYFNESNGQIARLEEPLDSPEGPATVVNTFDDYREVNGIKLPFAQIITMPGQTRKIAYAHILPNQEIDDTLFREPESN